jgi:WD40 repeat protein
MSVSILRTLFYNFHTTFLVGNTMPNEQRTLKVFLCHAHSDKNAVRDLYIRLTKDGVNAWLDKEKLLPGQDWEYEIRRAVRESDVVVVCLSKQFNQAGFRQKEVRLALDTAMEQPEGEIFIIPARLEECDNLESLRKWHWVDLFEDDGYEALMRALRARANRIGAILQEKRNWLSKSTGPRTTKQPIPEKKLIPTKRDEVRAETVKPKPRTRSAGRVLRKPNTAIIVALIGFIGTIVAGLLTSPLIERWFTPLPTPTPSVTITTTSTFQAPSPFQTTEPGLTPSEVAGPNSSPPAPTTEPNLTPSEVAGLNYNSLEQINPSNLERITRLDEAQFAGTVFPYSGIFWSPNSRAIAFNSWGPSVMYLNLEGHQEGLTNQMEAKLLGFSRDGNLMAYEAEEQGTISLWKNLLSPSSSQRLIGHTQGVLTAVVSSDGELLFTGSADNTVREWKVSDGTLLNTFVAHDNDVGSLAISPNKELLASSANDYSIRLWDVANGEILFKWQVEGLYSHPLVFSPDGDVLASYISDTEVVLWDLVTYEEIKTLECQERYNNTSHALLFSPDGQYLVVSFCNSGVAVWNVHSDDDPTFIDVAGPQKAIVLPDSSVLVLPQGENIGFYDMRTGDLLHTTELLGSLNFLDISPDGKVLFGTDYKSGYLWGIPK